MAGTCTCAAPAAAGAGVVVGAAAGAGGGEAGAGAAAGAEGLELHIRLVGLDLGDDVTALDRVALLLDPLDDLAGLHGLGELGHQDLGDHAQALRMAAAILALDGVLSSSRLRA